MDDWIKITQDNFEEALPRLPFHACKFVERVAKVGPSERSRLDPAPELVLVSFDEILVKTK